jgi:hypothetical protein
MAENENLQPKMYQWEGEQWETTQQEASDPGGDDCRYESQGVWNHKWTEELVKIFQRAAEEVKEVEVVAVEMAKEVEKVGM